MSARLSDHQLLARLVAFDSTSSKSNLPIAEFICDYLDLPGIEISRHPSPDGAKLNVVAWIGGESRVGPDRAGLVLGLNDALLGL